MFTPKPLTPLWIALPAGYVIIAVLAACGGGLGMVTSYWIWSSTTAVLGACVGILVFFPGYNHRWWTIAGIWGMVLGAVFGAYGTEWYKLRYGEKVTITASEAHRHPDAVIYDLSAGRPTMQHGIGQASVVGGHTTGGSVTAVVPVVEKDWDKSQPIAMWAVCPQVWASSSYAKTKAWEKRRDDGCGGDWKQPDWHLAIHADTSTGDEEIQAAIKRHTEHFKTKSAEGAVAVQWIGTIKPIIWKSGSVAFGWLIATLLGWPIVACGVRLAEFLARRKSAKAPPPQPPAHPPHQQGA